jgi:cytochrome subunit of sulfide dehydrogenase
MSSASKRLHVFLWLMASALTASAAEATSHLRVLASSCAACHGTDGNSVGGTPVLAGLDKTHFTTQMQAFRSGKRPSTVMHHHAKGLTEVEIEQLANYFSTQPRKAASVPMPLNF